MVQNNSSDFYTSVAATYLVYIMLYEACWVYYLRNEMGFDHQCCYLTIKLLAGLTKKITLFAQVIISHIMVYDVD
jgi:hypothetical protein